MRAKGMDRENEEPRQVARKIVSEPAAWWELAGWGSWTRLLPPAYHLLAVRLGRGQSSQGVATSQQLPMWYRTSVYMRVDKS